MRKKWLAFSVFLLWILAPALAQLPQVLSIVVNGVALQGKALVYKGRVYVAVEDLAQATGGTAHFDPHSKVLRATILSAPTATPSPPAAVNPQSLDRPWLQVVHEKQYCYGNNAVVFVTVRNGSQVVASNIQLRCRFKGDSREIGESLQRVPQLQPGQSTNLEFHLFEGEAPPVSGPLPPEGSILVNGSFTRITYELKMEYQ